MRACLCVHVRVRACLCVCVCAGIALFCMEGSARAVHSQNTHGLARATVNSHALHPKRILTPSPSHTVCLQAAGRKGGGKGKEEVKKQEVGVLACVCVRARACVRACACVCVFVAVYAAFVLLCM